jgi:hypothetical protein
MNRIRLSLAFTASVGLMLGSTPALAQAGAQVSAQQALAVWTETLKTAIPLGYWEGTMQELSSAGVVTSTNSDPECFTEASRTEMIEQITGVMGQIVAMGDCSATSGGPGSLNMSIACAFGSDKKLKIETAGTYGNDSLDLRVDFRAQGPDAPELGSAKLSGRRTRAC